MTTSSSTDISGTTSIETSGSTAKEVAGTAQQAAADTASAAGSAASEVVQTTKEQVGSVAAEATSQAKDLLGQGKEQLGQQAGAAAQKLGDSVRSLSAELRTMGDGSGDGSGPAAEIARTLAAKGDAVADFFADRSPGDLVADVRAYAARNPGTFLLGALAAGLVAGRFVRGAAAESGSASPATTAETGGPGAVPSEIASREQFALPSLADGPALGSAIAGPEGTLP
jgi:hypothetical protein